MRSSIQLFLRANARHLVELGLAGLAVNALGLALPLFTLLVYDKAIGNPDHDSLLALAIGMGLLLSLEVTLRFTRVMVVEHAGARWDARLDERLMRALLASPLSRSLSVGSVLARYREVAAAREVLSSALLLPVADLPFLLLFAGAMFAIAGPLVLVPVFTGVALLALGALLTAAARQRQRRADHLTAEKVTLLADVLATRESLINPAASKAALDAFRKPAAEASKAGSQARLWTNFSQQAVAVGMTASTVMTLVFGVYLIDAKQLSAGGLIAAVQIGARLVALLCGMTAVMARWRSFGAALRGLSELVDLNRAPSLAGSPSSGPGSGGSIQTEGVRLADVSFSYEGHNRGILNALNCKLNTGELVAVIGSSGSGKSTLLRLLAGQIAHQQGRLSFGGHLITNDEQRLHLAQNVTYKAQYPSFLGGSVSEVVAPGNSSPDQPRLLQALREAGLGGALDRNEIGLSSSVGTNGAGLSGGQQQMLALARVIHDARDVVLLDEPTLGLDHSAQESLHRALLSLKSQRLIVVATHTTELIQLADRVLVLDGGRLIADTSPVQLFATALPKPQPIRQGVTAPT